LARWRPQASDLCPGHDWPLTKEYMARTIGVKRNTNSNAAHNFAGSRHQQL
jgi:hypothetical protein